MDLEARVMFVGILDSLILSVCRTIDFELYQKNHLIHYHVCVTECATLGENLDNW